MLRLLSFLLNRPYEPCRTCKVYEKQLEILRAEKKDLQETLINFIRPQRVEPQPKSPEDFLANLSKLTTRPGTWSARRAALEARDREQARILRDSPNVGIPDNGKIPTPTTLSPDASLDIDKLEIELGIASEEEENVQSSS